MAVSKQKRVRWAQAYAADVVAKNKEITRDDLLNNIQSGGDIGESAARSLLGPIVKGIDLKLKMKPFPHYVPNMDHNDWVEKYRKEFNIAVMQPVSTPNVDSEIDIPFSTKAIEDEYKSNEEHIQYLLERNNKLKRAKAIVERAERDLKAELA